MDSSSNSQFKKIAKNYLKNVHGVVLVFDLTNKQSFENLNNWIKLVNENIHNCSCMILVGNKLDLNDNIQVPSEIAKNKATSNGVEYIESSAKLNVNVDTIFESLTITIFNVFGVKEKHDLRKKNSSDNNSESNSGSCQIQ
jgi:small GTP-binding protein